MRPETNRAPGRLASALLAIAALATAWPAVPLLAQGGIPAYALPLQRGNSWTYDGTVWWVPHSRRVLEERVTLEMEVVEVVEWGRMRGAILKGFPRDLVTAAPDRFAGEFTLFQIGSTVHLLRGEAGREAIRRLRDRDASVADLVRDSEVVLDLPLTAGETFCSRDGSSGSRSRVCWSVEKEDPVEVLPVAGVPARRHRERYILDLRSGAEDEIRGFVPGVGFTSFAIGNFGDPSALELELVEVHLMAPPGTFLKTLDLADGPAVEMATDSRSPEPESPSLSAADPSNVAGAALAASTATTQAPAGEDVADAAPAPPAMCASHLAVSAVHGRKLSGSVSAIASTTSS
ncbi:MAG: hypothetical protein ACREK5_07435 [Gemmatimonadota bacterium]